MRNNSIDGIIIIIIIIIIMLKTLHTCDIINCGILPGKSQLIAFICRSAQEHRASFPGGFTAPEAIQNNIIPGPACI